VLGCQHDEVLTGGAWFGCSGSIGSRTAARRAGEAKSASAEGKVRRLGG